MEILTPALTYLLMVCHDEIHHICQITSGQLASIARKDASTVSCEPNLRSMWRWATFGNMNVNRFSVFARPEENGKSLK